MAIVLERGGNGGDGGNGGNGGNGDRLGRFARSKPRRRDMQPSHRRTRCNDGSPQSCNRPAQPYNRHAQPCNGPAQSCNGRTQNNNGSPQSCNCLGQRCNCRTQRCNCLTQPCNCGAQPYLRRTTAQKTPGGQETAPLRGIPSTTQGIADDHLRRAARIRAERPLTRFTARKRGPPGGP